MRFIILLVLLFSYSLALSWKHFLGEVHLRERHQFEMTMTKRKREKPIQEPVLPVDLLFGDGIPVDFKAPSKTYLSDDVEHMDAATLLHLIEKLKEEYAGKVARGEDAEKVRNSFDRLASTLHSLTQGASGRPDITGTLAMLSEEESQEDEESGVVYGGDYYTDLYGGGAEEVMDDPDPSLLELQAWTKKLSTGEILRHTNL